MKNTIRAKHGYRIVRVKNIITGERCLRIDDGERPIFVAKMRSFADYKDEERGNDAFCFCEVFTTVDGRQFIYWRDEEIDQDYITEVASE